MKSKTLTCTITLIVALGLMHSSAFAFGRKRHAQPTAPQTAVPAPDPAPVDPQPQQPFPYPGPIAPEAAVQQRIVRITSINGNYQPNHDAQISVNPGDVVTLSADLLDANNGYTALGDNVEDFAWSASDQSSDSCDAQNANDCLTGTNFQVNDYGVSFYVPYSIGQSITITVQSHDPSAVDANGNPYTDTITLVNALYSDNYVAPTQIVTSADDYHNDRFIPEFALAGQGRWVTIDGVRYWSPYSYVGADGGEWVPYQHGYWSWTNDEGFTWTSYDPWGWATDHYGAWRHHGTYGWVWKSFDDNQYRPHAVTFMDHEMYMGWYPYSDQFQYAQGEESGFDDGYWLGRDAARGFGGDGYGFHPGYTFVQERDFTRADISLVVISRDERDANFAAIVNGSYSDGHFYGEPGGADRNSSRGFMQKRVSGQIPTTETETGGNGLRGPKPLHSVPTEYKQVAQSHGDDFNRPHAVGTVVSVANGHAEAVPPTTNGRGIVTPPSFKGSDNKPVQLPPRSTNPAAPNSQNPVTKNTHQAPPADPHQGGTPPAAPKLNPGQPGAPVPPARPGNPGSSSGHGGTHGGTQPAPQQPAPAPKQQPAPEQPAPQQPTPEQPAPQQPTPEQPAPAPKHGGSGHGQGQQPAPEQPAPQQPAPAPKQQPAPQQPAPAPKQGSGHGQGQQPAAPAQPPAPKQQPVAPAQPPAPKQQPVAPAQPPAPKQQPVAPAQPPAPKQQPVAPAQPPAPKQQPVAPAQPPAPKQQPVAPAQPAPGPKPSGTPHHGKADDAE
jgi:hypothetical protein